MCVPMHMTHVYNYRYIHVRVTMHMTHVTHVYNYRHIHVCVTMHMTHMCSFRHIDMYVTMCMTHIHVTTDTKKSLFCLMMPLEHNDFHIIS